jgi:ComF family protein
MIYFLKKFAAWLVPHVCVLCRNITHRSQDLCLSCLEHLPIVKQSCLACANILPAMNQTELCGQCLKQKPPFDMTHALFVYRPPIPKLIRDLKFHHALTHAKLFGELLAEKIFYEWYQKKSLPTAIIPVPLHNARLKERGFNQAIEIARPIAKTLKLPLILHDTIRIKSTVPQTRLTANERKLNIKNAFLIKKTFENQHIAVVDDVITTGNTIHEFCRLLKQHGAAKISVWCCARRQY